MGGGPTSGDSLSGEALVKDGIGVWIGRESDRRRKRQGVGSRIDGHDCGQDRHRAFLSIARFGSGPTQANLSAKLLGFFCS